MLAGKGDLLPVSAFPVDGTWPVSTAKWEKRNIALEIPVWDSKICIQCNQCALVCPHAAIRAKVYDAGALVGAPETFKSTAYRGNEHKGKLFTIQVAPEDCTGCNLCVNVCPAKDRTNPKHKAIDMHPQAPLRDTERTNYSFFLNLPELDRTDDRARSTTRARSSWSRCSNTRAHARAVARRLTSKCSRSFSAIVSSSRTPRVARRSTAATCRRHPTRRIATAEDPAWSNSLFEDNAEFGFGFRMALDAYVASARALVQRLAPQIGDGLVTALLDADQSGEGGIAAQRERVTALRQSSRA